MPNQHTSHVRYPRHRAAVPKARSHARDLAHLWDVPELADDLALVVTELVTNAVLHGSTGPNRQVAVTYHLNALRLRVEVRDPGDGTPTLQEPRPADAENGRGLLIVCGLADAWGVDPLAVGKTTWAAFHLDAERTAPEAREATPC